jgi:hypothetical protein
MGTLKDARPFRQGNLINTKMNPKQVTEMINEFGTPEEVKKQLKGNVERIKEEFLKNGDRAMCIIYFNGEVKSLVRSKYFAVSPQKPEEKKLKYAFKIIIWSNNNGKSTIDHKDIFSRAEKSRGYPYEITF